MSLTCIILGGTLFVTDPEHTKIISPNAMYVDSGYVVAVSGDYRLFTEVDKPDHPWYGLTAVQVYEACYDSAMEDYLEEEK